MIRLFVAAFSSLFASLAGLSAEIPPLIIENVHVVPMDEERVLERQTVIIEDGRIRSIGTDLEKPSGAEMIDGSGKFLMPGLAEMHAHVPGSNESETYREDVLFLYLANGVTLIRGMLGDPIHLELREQLETGEVAGPRFVVGGPSFNGRSAPTPEAAEELVKNQQEAGYDFIKVASGSREAFDAMAAAAKERDFPFSGHVPAAVGVKRALEAGYASIDHLDAYMPELVDPEKAGEIDGGFFGYLLAPFAEPERIQAMARETRAAGVWNVPTETLMHAVLTTELEGLREKRPEFRYMPSRVVDGWFDTVRNRRNDSSYDRKAGETFLKVRLDLIRALHEEGAGLLLGSDAPQFFNVPGFSLHRELEAMVGSGLSPYELLKTGTVNPAKFFGDEDYGRVEEGFRADLILLDANPLEDVKNASRIAGVIRSGKWFSRAEIDRRLEEIAARQE